MGDNKLLSKSFLWMCIGLLVTFVTGFGVSMNGRMLENIFGGSGFWILIILEFVLVIVLSARVMKMNPTTAKICFILYSFVSGLTFSSIFVVYELTSIMMIFLVSAIIFGIMAFIGYTTKVDLSRVGFYLLMALLGVILVSIIILILALLISGYFYLSSPKRIITGYTNSLYDSFEKDTGVNYDSINMNLNIIPTINGIEDKNIENVINKLGFALSGGIDYKNKILKYNLMIDYDKENLLNVDMKYNKDLYLKLNNLYDNSVKIEDNNFSNVFKKSETKDLKVVVKGYIDAFNSSLKDKYINTKNKDGYKVVTIDLTGDNYKMISKDISNKLLNNKEFIKSYANMNDKEESEVKEDLKDIDDGEFNGIKVSLYTKGLFGYI